MLRTLHIIVCRSKKLADHALDIVTDITGLRQRSRIGDRKRHIKKTRQSLYQIGLTGTGRSDHEHVGLLDLHTILIIGHHTLVMVVHGNRHHFLRMFLTYHILIKACLNLMRCRNRMNVEYCLFFLFLRFLFLDLLRLRNTSLQIRQIDHADIGHLAHIHIHDVTHVESTGVHRIERLLHTIVADADSLLDMDHLARNTLRSAADVADILVFIILICIIYCIFILIFRHYPSPFHFPS